MIRNRILTVAASVAALSGLASADATSDFKKMYMKEMPKLFAAFKNKDISFFKSMSTEDFTLETKAEGKMNKQRAMAGLQQMFGMMKTIDYKCTPTKFNVKANAAVVSVIERGSGEMAPGADKKKHTMSWEGYYDQTLVKVKGKWLMKSLVETKAGKTMMDGKPFDPSKMMPVSPPPRPKSSKG